AANTLAVERTPPRPRSLDTPGAYPAAHVIETAPLDVARLEAEDATQIGGPQRVGVVQELGPATLADGTWIRTADGGRLWSVVVHAAGAQGVRLHIRLVDSPPGAELTVFDTRHPEHAFGPYPRAGQRRGDAFWTPILFGDRAQIEYYLPPGLDTAVTGTRLELESVLNMYRLAGQRELACHLDVMCYPGWAPQRDGVGAVYYIEFPYSYFCSGCLLNRIPGDLTPIFETARHCGVRDTNVESATVTWFYQANVCNGTPPAPSTLPQTSAVAVIATTPDMHADWMLLGLESTLPGGAFLLGWNNGFWPEGVDAIGISHPAGTYKRITFGTRTAPSPGRWRMSVALGDGALEPGSSGSPGMDDGGGVRGTLSEASGNCDDGFAASYGRLDLAWPYVQPMLAPSDPTDIYVDAAFGGFELGTLAQPFTRVIKGVFAVERTQNVHIEAGTYNESMVIDKAMTLRSQNGSAVIGGGS
ncbi:MAG: hypothetical protein PVF43_16240, partial [Candidatus Eiseniibacteriota bacterium]